jgi:hypothetical protein
MAICNVTGQLFIDQLFTIVPFSMYQNLPNLDTFATCTQCILHTLTTPYDGDTTKLLAKIHPNINRAWIHNQSRGVRYSSKLADCIYEGNHP